MGHISWERFEELEGRIEDLEEDKITLRDFFAGCALMGLVACDKPMNCAWSHEEQAGICYDKADAMLEARGEK